MSAFVNNEMTGDDAFIYDRNSDGTENKTSINSYAGAKREHIVIPEQVKTIGSQAFYSSKCQTILLPNHLENIGMYSFYDNQLTSIVLPNTLLKIEANAFANNKITSIIIPSSITTIAPEAFSDNALTSVEFKGNVPANLETGIFQNNNGLTAHTIKVPTGTLERYKTAQGKENNILQSPSKTWFGRDDDQLLDAFYE